ncbi:MAG: cupin domain-containing protein [Ruminococcaceae bacterium]|nr:cupin domain-containing protein [Oscillospiraceae bacterium]
MNNQITGLDLKIKEMATRIKELREIEGISESTMSRLTDVSVEEYIACENGQHDLSFAFIYRCALAFNVDVTDIIEGVSPTLKSYTVTRSGKGQKIEQAHGMVYYNLAPDFKNRVAEPLYVNCVYDAEAEKKDIELTTHEGQEVDIVISGALKVQIGSHTEVLHAGDSIYYNSKTPHGMVAVEGSNCEFYAIVLSDNGESEENAVEIANPKESKSHQPYRRIYHNFIHPTEDERGALLSLRFENEDKFNFAFDIVDELAKKRPDKLAMLHIDSNKNEKRFTFDDMRRESNKVANYLKSLGVKKGDRVMLVLKRHYQFWFSILALHKLGAIAIPATNQLLEHDFTYRFNAAGVSAIICTADDNVPDNVDLAQKDSPTLATKIIVGKGREGWHNFNEEYELYSDNFERTEDTPCGNDLMLMFFTSGTTGYPKIAAHSYKYPLGHFVTANYWHCVNPDGLHFTISDTGWAKSSWGKLYGQWLCEAATFVFDFDRFNAAEILPLFKKHNITTFCAPPTMYRMLIKEDLTKYDMSSIEHATTAGEALNPEVFNQFKRLTGLQIIEGFGQSETTLLIGNLFGGTHKIGSMGKPVPGYDVSLIDTEGNPVGVGKTGEIVIRTDERVPCGLFREYYLDEEKTKEAWYDGYYHTGDLATQDEDGFYWYVGRIDDVIKSSGYRIGPFEIENVIMELPYVLECGVSAAPDEVRGQVVKASIVLTNGTLPSEELKKEIQRYVKEHTAPYKYPRIVEFKTELPKTTSGKIIRSKL